MSITAGSLLSTLGDRIRDPNFYGLSTSQTNPNDGSGATFGYQILSQAQNFVNALTGEIIANAAFTTSAYKLLYGPMSNDSTLSGFTKVTTIVSDTDLDYMPFEQLQLNDFNWLHRYGQRFQNWSLFGRDLLILYPGLTKASSVTVYGIQYIPALTKSTDTLTLPDDMSVEVLDIAEALALLKLRKLQYLEPVLKRIAERYKNEIAVDRWLRTLKDLT